MPSSPVPRPMPRPDDAPARRTGRRLPGFALHDFTTAHLPEVTDLWVASWAAAMPDIDFAARRAWFVDHLLALREGGARVLCAFALADGTMAGFVTIHPETGWLDQLAVATAYQGSGAAKTLLDAARNISPRGIRLDVNQTNGRARAFYTRAGFVETGRGQNATSGLATLALHWQPP